MFTRVLTLKNLDKIVFLFIYDVIFLDSLPFIVAAVDVNGEHKIICHAFINSSGFRSRLLVWSWCKLLGKKEIRRPTCSPTLT